RGYVITPERVAGRAPGTSERDLRRIMLAARPICDGALKLPGDELLRIGRAIDLIDRDVDADLLEGGLDDLRCFDRVRERRVDHDAETRVLHARLLDRRGYLLHVVLVNVKQRLLTRLVMGVPRRDDRVAVSTAHGLDDPGPVHRIVHPAPIDLTRERCRLWIQAKLESESPRGAAYDLEPSTFQFRNTVRIDVLNHVDAARLQRGDRRRRVGEQRHLDAVKIRASRRANETGSLAAPPVLVRYECDRLPGRPVLELVRPGAGGLARKLREVARIDDRQGLKSVQHQRNWRRTVEIDANCIRTGRHRVLHDAGKEEHVLSRRRIPSALEVRDDSFAIERRAAVECDAMSKLYRHGGQLVIETPAGC